MVKLISPGKKFNDQIITGLEVDQAEIFSSEFIDCAFEECSLIETEIKNCRFVNCAFVRCDLSLAKVPESVFSSIRFEDAKLVGIDWTLAEWPATLLGKPLNFSKSILNHGTFIGLNLEGVQFIDCAVVNVDFREADLSGADFSGSNLFESLFIHTNLKNADLSQARNYSINLGLNQIKGAKFSLPEAMSLLYNMDIILTSGENES